jgi:ParB/RepB/Spo0J family partition protein
VPCAPPESSTADEPTNGAPRGGAARKDAAMTVATAKQVKAIEPKLLLPHPDNPRGRLEEDDVADLLPIVKAQGQQQPCVVRPHPDSSGKYQVVIGHRRAFVARLLKRPVPCLVVGLTDDEALAVMLADNPSHAAPDPLRESEAVAAFLRFPGFSLKDVAERLGKSPRWVAQRANLQNLAPELRRDARAPGSLTSRWPVAWLERVAVLAAEEQGEVLREVENTGGVESQRDIEAIVARYTNKLAAAPWDLDDAVLVPAAGACTACPKQSMHTPGLFDDGEPAGDLRKATCRDLSCWKKKLGAHAKGAVKDLREKHPDMVAVKGKDSWQDAPGDQVRAPGLKVLPEHSYAAAKKGQKGAVPALVVAGTGKGRVKWVKPKLVSSGTSSSPPALTPRQKAAEEKRQLLERRARLRNELLRKAVCNAPCPFLAEGESPELALHPLARAVLAFGAVPEDRRAWLELKRGLAAFEASATTGAETLAVRLWESVRQAVADAWRNPGTLVAELATFARVDLVPIEEEVLRQIPDPREVGEIEQGVSRGAASDAGEEE